MRLGILAFVILEMNLANGSSVIYADFQLRDVCAGFRPRRLFDAGSGLICGEVPGCLGLLSAKGEWAYREARYENGSQ